MNLDDVAEYLRTGRGKARSWLIANGVRPALELGRGKGGGPRYRADDVIGASRRLEAEAQRRWTRTSIFDGTLSQAMAKLGRSDRGRKEAVYGDRKEGQQERR